MVAASEPNHPAHRYFHGRHQLLRTQVEMFAADPHTRTIGEFDPDTRATLYMALMDGLQLQWILDPEADVIAAAGGFADLILRPRAR